MNKLGELAIKILGELIIKIIDFLFIIAVIGAVIYLLCQ